MGPGLLRAILTPSLSNLPITPHLPPFLETRSRSGRFAIFCVSCRRDDHCPNSINSLHGSVSVAGKEPWHRIIRYNVKTPKRGRCGDSSVDLGLNCGPAFSPLLAAHHRRSPGSLNAGHLPDAALDAPGRPRACCLLSSGAPQRRLRPTLKPPGTAL